MPSCSWADPKFAAAALEEIAKAAPELRPCLAGAAMSFLHAEHDADNAVFTAAAQALRADRPRLTAARGR